MLRFVIARREWVFRATGPSAVRAISVFVDLLLLVEVRLRGIVFDPLGRVRPRAVAGDPSSARHGTGGPPRNDKMCEIRFSE